MSQKIAILTLEANISGLNAPIGECRTSFKNYMDEAEQRLCQHDDKLMRKTFMYLVSGKLRLNVFHRLGQINMPLQVLALNNQLADALRWNFFHQTQGG